MTAERSVEKAVRVFVPADLYKKLFPNGKKDAVADYILKTDTEDVINILLEGEFLNTHDSVSVTFVPDEKISEDSLVRTLKCITVSTDRLGQITDANVAWKEVDIYTDHVN